MHDAITFRQELLNEHFQHLHSQEDKDAEERREDKEPEWYPAGISPLHIPKEGPGDGGGTLPSPEVIMAEMRWMDSKNISAKELHDAAFHIQR